jgi:hypothetical protein
MNLTEEHTASIFRVAVHVNSENSNFNILYVYGLLKCNGGMKTLKLCSLGLQQERTVER